jgi:hypothetical protein
MLGNNQSAMQISASGAQLASVGREYLFPLLNGASGFHVILVGAANPMAGTQIVVNLNGVVWVMVVDLNRSNELTRTGG